MHGILSDIKVVEFAQNVAVPHCGRLLASMGADVVKVEPPGGDAMRLVGSLAPMEGMTYARANPGKRSIALDLQADGARAVVDALFAWADVALVAFKKPDIERYGLEWERARTINPRLVHLTHTPFGPEGPDADGGGYDVLAQAISGIGFFMNRSEGGVPQSTRPAVNDVGAGIYSALGVVAALRYRDQTGEGQRVDTSLLGTAVAFGLPVLGSFAEADPPRIAQVEEEVRQMQTDGASFDEIRGRYEASGAGGAALFKVYFRHYRTADGLVSVAALSPALRRRFHQATGLGEPASIAPGSPELDHLVGEAESLFTQHRTDHWLEQLRAAGMPCARYNLPFEVFDDPQVKANGFMVELDHPTFGPYQTIGNPLQFSETPTVISEPSPTFAEHSTEVLAEIGFDAATSAWLIADGIILDGA